jgi:signal transduction histidine kinase
VNEAACALLGRSVSELRGRRLNDFLEADGAEPPEAAFEAVEAGGTTEENAPEEKASEKTVSTSQAEARVERPDGTVRQVRLQLRSLTVGPRRHTAAALQDMTAVSVEHTLFRRFHRCAVEDAPLELAVLSPEGTYLYANPPACTDGVSPDWLLGKTDFDLCQRLGLHPEVALRRRSHRRRTLQRGERVQFKEVLSRRDAPPRHVERFYTPVFEKDGEAHAVVTYALDRTEQKRQIEALEEAQRASQEYEEMKTTLLRNLRHEFRTPLTSVMSAAEVLREDVASAEIDFVDIIHESGERLLKTLNAMLDLAGTQTGSFDRDPRVVNLSQAASHIVGELEPTAEDKGLFLREQVLDEKAFVRVDPASVYRVLRSIIGNAVKFTEEGGIVVEVDIEAGRAEVRVIDTGVGIDEAYRSKLFEAFRQEDGSMTRHFEGVGVGLSVARQLLSLMGGSVSVDSEKGEGSVFTVSVPLAFRNASGEPPRVLVVEPREEQRKILHHHLGAHLPLTYTQTLDAALEAAQHRRFAAVLVSAGLTAERAAESAAESAADSVDRFRAIEKYRDVPLIVIDEDALPGAAEQFAADGYDGYVARPIQRERLLNVLGDALEEAVRSGNARLDPARLDSETRARLGMRA